MMGRMAAEFLGGNRIVVALPSASADELASACEVLAQERLRCWTVPAERVDQLPALAERFPHRALLGVHGVRRDAEAVAAVEAGAAFVLSPVARASLVHAVEVPVILGGMTPTEIDKALGDGAAAVAVVPADVQGSFLARALVGMFPGAPPIPSGALERFQVEEWLRLGALAAHLSGLITDSSRTNLGELRSLVRGWRSIASG
jgi:2-dehydro-3-deoxyphosphogluconate aldolase / (4S)-4-hydroxy-2-oxoglutarate aldolase